MGHSLEEEKVQLWCWACPSSLGYPTLAIQHPWVSQGKTMKNVFSSGSLLLSAGDGKWIKQRFLGAIQVEQVHWTWLLFPEVPWSILARVLAGTDFISARSTCPQHQRCSRACTCAQGAKESRKLSQNSGYSPQKVLKCLVGSTEHEILFLHWFFCKFYHCNLLEKTEPCSWRRDYKNHDTKPIIYVWKWSHWSQHHIPPRFIQLHPAWDGSPNCIMEERNWISFRNRHTHY